MAKVKKDTVTKKEHELKRYTFYYLLNNNMRNIDLFAKSEPGAYKELYEICGKDVVPMKFYKWQSYPSETEFVVMDGES